MFWVFGRETCGILALPPGIEPSPPALEGKVLTTGQPGKSPCSTFKSVCHFELIFVYRVRFRGRLT